jgi:hypothetical protein
MGSPPPGRLIADQRGALQLAVSSSEQVRLIDLFESCRTTKSRASTVTPRAGPISAPT